MIEVWYILEDEAIGDPRDIARGADGVLRHKDGRVVAYAPHGPRSRMVSAEEVASYRTRELRAETPSEEAKPKRAYRTREMKAD